MTVENTTKRDPKLILAEAMLFGTSNAIESMEAKGQRELVASEVLPRVTKYAADGETEQTFVELGFEFGAEETIESQYAHDNDKAKASGFLAEAPKG